MQHRQVPGSLGRRCKLVISKLQQVIPCRQHRADVVFGEALKVFTHHEGQSNRAPVVQAVFHRFLWYGHNGGYFEMWGVQVENTSHLTCAQLMWPGMPSGPLALSIFSHWKDQVMFKTVCINLFSTSHRSSLFGVRDVCLKASIKSIKLAWQGGSRFYSRMFFSLLSVILIFC